MADDEMMTDVPEGNFNWADEVTAEHAASGHDAAVLEAERVKAKKRAERFGQEYKEPKANVVARGLMSRKEVLAMRKEQALKKMNRRGEFVAGIDVFDPEEEAKRAARAAKFGTNAPSALTPEQQAIKDRRDAQDAQRLVANAAALQEAWQAEGDDRYINIDEYFAYMTEAYLTERADVPTTYCADGDDDAGGAYCPADIGTCDDHDADDGDHELHARAAHARGYALQKRVVDRARRLYVGHEHHAAVEPPAAFVAHEHVGRDGQGVEVIRGRVFAPQILQPRRGRGRLRRRARHRHVHGDVQVLLLVILIVGHRGVLQALGVHVVLGLARAARHERELIRLGVHHAVLHDARQGVPDPAQVGDHARRGNIYEEHRARLLPRGRHGGVQARPPLGNWVPRLMGHSFSKVGTPQKK